MMNKSFSGVGTDGGETGAELAPDAVSICEDSGTAILSVHSECYKQNSSPLGLLTSLRQIRGIM